MAAANDERAASDIGADAPGIEQKCQLYHTLSELEFTFRGFFRRRRHGCWWRRDEEGDHGSPGRVGRADLQLSGTGNGGTLTVPRGLGPRATLLCREMKRKATAALTAMGLTGSEAGAAAVPPALPFRTAGSPVGFRFSAANDRGDASETVSPRRATTGFRSRHARTELQPQGVGWMIGRIQRVGLRKVWSHEALDFTKC